MLDIRLIRDNPDAVKAAIATLNTTAPIDLILVADIERRGILTALEAKRADLNDRSKLVNRTKDPVERKEMIERLRDLGDTIAALNEDETKLEARLRELLLQVPNLPLPQVPVGMDDSTNVITDPLGTMHSFDFEPKPHWEIGEQLGIIDFERGVKIAGSRFYVLRGDGARLQRALIAWMLDLHIQQHGHTEIRPPYMVLGEMLVGTGNLPKFGDVLFRDIHEDKWMIPTAEVPVTNLYRDEILDESLLPIYHVAYTPCFRREQISAGRDVRGIKRGYQFDKVEMVKFVHPDQSDIEHKRLIGEAEDVLKGLDLPYRFVQMCTGDLSFTAANKVDLETWAPGSQEWLEVSSCSTFGDFQARRANLRFRPEGGGKPQFLHTLNGSGLALPRTVISIIENNQREDGSFTIPKVLVPYMGATTEIGPQPPIGPARRQQS